MKKVISLSLMSMFLILSSVASVFAAEGPLTPAFGFAKADQSYSRSIEADISPGSVSTVELDASNFDDIRNITLGFNTTGSQTDNVNSLPTPSEWFIFSPQDLILPANNTQKVQVKIMVPDNTKPGLYEGIIQAVLKGYDNAPETKGAVKINTGIGVTVNLNVKEINKKASEPSQSENPVSGSSADSSTSIYIYLAIAALVVLLLVYFVKSETNKKK